MKQIGMLGLGKMGANMARRLARGGTVVHAWNRSHDVALNLAQEHPNVMAQGSLADLVAGLVAPRLVWLMLPAGRPTEDALEALLTSSPEAFGYRGQLWTIGMLKTQIELQHELSLSDDTVQRAVHELDYRYKRPRYVLARRDPFWQQAKGGSKTA